MIHFQKRIALFCPCVLQSCLKDTYIFFAVITIDGTENERFIQPHDMTNHDANSCQISHKNGNQSSQPTSSNITTRALHAEGPQNPRIEDNTIPNCIELSNVHNGFNNTAYTNSHRSSDQGYSSEAILRIGGLQSDPNTTLDNPHLLFHPQLKPGQTSKGGIVGNPVDGNDGNTDPKQVV